jgi:alkaline phosphatase D
MKNYFAWILVACIVLMMASFLPQTSAQSATRITHGPLSGEISAEGAMLWARANAEGIISFTVKSGDETVAQAEVAVDESTDFTGEVHITGLTAGTAYTYTATHSAGGPEVAGSFTTAPADDAEAGFSFVFGGCLGGQGYCRNPETGWDIFNTMAGQNPDFFLMVGDGVYVDSACPIEDNRNVAGAETVATDLAGFYGRYKYHLEDSAYASFLAQTPVYVTWDDHEILDNFGGKELLRLNPDLFNEGRKAFFDYWPLATNEASQIYRQFSYGAHADFFVLDTRSYRDPLVNWDPSPVTGVHKTMLGAEQFAWLQESLAASDATWKFIITSVPVSYPTGFPQPQVEGRDSWANGADKSGYETEMMRLLFFIEAHDVENVVFLTADTHWPFAIEYDPDLDGEVNFMEFGSSPLSAITLPPGPVDQTFNPTVLFAEGEFAGTSFNFGQVSVSDTGELTVRIVNRTGEEMYSLTRSPR